VFSIGVALAPLIEFSSRPCDHDTGRRRLQSPLSNCRFSCRWFAQDVSDFGDMSVASPLDAVLLAVTMKTDDIAKAEQMLGYTFRDHTLLKRALTHASLADSRLESNERLEFLGDAILGMVVCEYLFEHYEGLLEGEMTKIKSTVVSRRVCAEVAIDLGLDELLRLGKGMSNRADLPGSVVAAVYEALIGAIYIDGGMESARRFILDGLKPFIERAEASGHQSNFKSVLQQASQQHFQMTPQYLVLDEKGPDHAKCFEVCVEIGARRFPSAWGASKKEAEQVAALYALTDLGLASQVDGGEVQIEQGSHSGSKPTLDDEKRSSAQSD